MKDLGIKNLHHNVVGQREVIEDDSHALVLRLKL
jgi:hypothetical protein